MCNCLSETIQKIKAELPQKSPAYANMKILSASFDNEAIMFDGSPNQLGYPVTIKHEPIGRKKQTTVNFIGSFCPFCGEPIKKGADDPAKKEAAV